MPPPAAHHHNGRKVLDCCEICGDPISFLEKQNNRSREIQICTSAECHNILKQKSVLPAAAFNLYLKNHQEAIKQRKQKTIAKQKQLENEHQENQLIFKAVSQQYSTDSTPIEHKVILPTARNQLAPLPEERVDEYLKYLRELIEEAEHYSSLAQVPFDNNQKANDKLKKQEAKYANQPRLKNTLDSLCMKCQGSCCASGGEHAYHSLFSIRRILDENPDLDGNSLLAFYQSRIQNTSVARGCVNQSDQGCVVPREFRADICNQFYCRSIALYDAEITSDEQLAPIVAIQRKHSLWNRGNGSDLNNVTSISLINEEQVELIDIDSLNIALEDASQNSIL